MFVQYYSLNFWSKAKKLLPRPGQNFVSAATLRSVLEMEIGSLGSATAETRSRSFVAERIRHFRIIGCFSPTANEKNIYIYKSARLIYIQTALLIPKIIIRTLNTLCLPTGERCWNILLTGSPSFRNDQHSTMLPIWLDAHSNTFRKQTRTQFMTPHMLILDNFMGVSLDFDSLQSLFSSSSPVIFILICIFLKQRDSYCKLLKFGTTKNLFLGEVLLFNDFCLTTVLRVSS